MAKNQLLAAYSRRKGGSMEKEKNSVAGNLIIISLLSPIIIFLLYFWIPSSPITYNKHYSSLGIYQQCPPLNSTTVHVQRDELEEALDAASTANKTVIIAVVNKAYVEGKNSIKTRMTMATTTMLDLFLESFWLGDDTRPLLDNLLLVAVDQTSYDRCKFRRLHCYRLKTDGVDFGGGGEKLYMSGDFIKMMWRRTEFLLDVLKRNYNFIFTDTDVMWLRNPFPILINSNKNTNTNTTADDQDEDHDIQISTDVFNGNPRSENHLINTGFYYIKSNNKTIALFEKWYGLKDNSTGKKEQDVLVGLMQHGVFKQLGLNVKFLDTNFFSGFCQRSKDFWVVSTVHANCCRTINAKVADLTATLNDWKRFKWLDQHRRLAGNLTSTMKWTKPHACYNSWNVANTTLV